MTFQGAITALITPFKDGGIDEDAFARFIEWQIDQGIHGVVPCGTTGESPTLDHNEHDRVIEQCVDVVNGRIPVMAGTGSNSTAEAVRLIQHAQDVKADAALIATPYYNKPTQEGLYLHYKTIHDNSDLPIYIYNIPGRSVVDMTSDTIVRLAKECPRIAGIKDATSDLERPRILKQKLKDINPDFIQLSGEDETAVAFNEAGGIGCISVSANVMPKEIAEIQKLCLEGDIETAQARHLQIMALHDVLFCETSPAPVKYALSLMGHCESTLRLPMTQPSAENQQRIKGVLSELGLI